MLFEGIDKTVALFADGVSITRKRGSKETTTFFFDDLSSVRFRWEPDSRKTNCIEFLRNGQETITGLKALSANNCVFFGAHRKAEFLKLRDIVAGRLANGHFSEDVSKLIPIIPKANIGEFKSANYGRLILLWFVAAASILCFIYGSAVVAALLAILAFFIIVSIGSKQRSDRALPNFVDVITRKHLSTLRIQLNQRRTVDPYGNPVFSKADEHVTYFITQVIFPEFRSAGYNPKLYAHDQDALTWIRKKILQLVLEDIAQNPSQEIDDVKTGLDYETFCRDALEKDGWQVAMTPITGDQGADLIATKENMRVVIQCKFYGQPVGNKAVQEVFAAKTFQKADHAAVVSNASFTPAARQLASTNGVLLLHHDELRHLDDLIRR